MSNESEKHGAEFGLAFAVVLNAMASKAEQAIREYKDPNLDSLTKVLKSATARANVLMSVKDDLLEAVHKHSKITGHHIALVALVGSCAQKMDEEVKERALSISAAGVSALSLLGFFIGISSMCTILDHYYAPQVIERDPDIDSDDIAEKLAGSASELINESFSEVGDLLQGWHEELESLLEGFGIHSNEQQEFHNNIFGLDHNVPEA